MPHAAVVAGAATGFDAADPPRAGPVAPRTLSPDRPRCRLMTASSRSTSTRAALAVRSGRLAAILHLLPLLLLVLIGRCIPPAEIEPIPVQLVFQPPPPPPPMHKADAQTEPKPKPETRPPPGRIASENLGDTKVKGHDRVERRTNPRRTKSRPTTVESPLEAPQQDRVFAAAAAIARPAEARIARSRPTPGPIAAPKPPPKPSLALASAGAADCRSGRNLLPRWREISRSGGDPRRISRLPRLSGASAYRVAVAVADRRAARRDNHQRAGARRRHGGDAECRAQLGLSRNRRSESSR